MELAGRLGVVDIVYGDSQDVAERSRRAAADGFDHIDVLTSVEPSTLALPVGCPTAFPKPLAQWCATPAPTRGDDAAQAWERTVRWWRAAPGALLEPWAGASVHSIETIRAFLDEVPGTRFLIDTGHVASWGGDPVELCEFADHIQLRQGALGRTQLHVDDADGVVDFAAVLRRLEEIGYRGVVSVEYFDLPEHGWALEDPRGWALDLAAHLRALG